MGTEWYTFVMKVADGVRSEGQFGGVDLRVSAKRFVMRNGRPWKEATAGDSDEPVS